jgi:uncharacterized membrane protein
MHIRINKDGSLLSNNQVELSNYFSNLVDLKMVLIFLKRILDVRMTGISERIFSLAKFYSQMKSVFVIVNSFVKRAPAFFTT